jgi:hypothetical protein
MGFWPYFLHAQRSDGITSPPPGLLLAGGSAGIHTTFFTSFFLLQVKHICKMFCNYLILESSIYEFPRV